MSLLKSTGIIGGLTLVSRVADFARDRVGAIDRERLNLFSKRKT